MTTILQTERLRLREYTVQDLDELASMFADEETMRFYPRPKTRDECRKWIDWNVNLYAIAASAYSRALFLISNVVATSDGQ